MLKNIKKRLSKKGNELSGLNNRDEKYYSLFKNTSDGVTINSLDGRVLDINDAYCKMSGYTRDELIGKHISKIEAKENSKDIIAHINKVLKEGGHDRFETIHRRKNGTLFHADITLLYLDSEDGYIAAIIRDITESKKLEDLLRFKSNELKIILDSTPAMIFYKDAENNCIFVNKTFEKLMGIPKKKIEGKSLFDVFPRKLAQAYWEDDLEVIKSGKAKLGIIEQTETNQGTRFVQTDKLPYFDDKGNVIGVIGFVLDITQRKKAEEALLESEKKFRLAFENSQDAIFWADAVTGILTDCNIAAEKLVEKSKKEIVGKSFKSLHLQEEHSYANKKFFERVSGRFSPGPGVEFSVITKTGKTKIVLITSTVISLSGRKIIQEVFHDITGRKKLEEALMEANKRKDEFINIASHELKTPMTSIKAFNQILVKKMKDKKYEDELSLMNRMGEQINKLSSLISDFLDVTKIAAGELLLRCEYFDIMEMVKQTIADLKSIMPETGNKIVVKGQLNNKIYGDKFRLSQVLMNLLTNADKYASESKNFIILIKQMKKYIRVSVRDFGKGIDTEHQKRIFERFYQVNSSGNSPKGIQSLGMGLYIASEIIRRHGGKIWVKSIPGKGSTFYFTLPIDN